MQKIAIVIIGNLTIVNIHSIQTYIHVYVYNVYIIYIWQLLQKPAMLLCWTTLSEVDVGDLAVGAELSHQYSITFFCRVTDGSIWAVWQNGIWHGSAHKAKVSLNFNVRKSLFPLTFVEACWTFIEIKHWMWAQWGDGWCISAVVTATVGNFCWCRFLWV